MTKKVKNHAKSLLIKFGFVEKIESSPKNKIQLSFDQKIKITVITVIIMIIMYSFLYLIARVNAFYSVKFFSIASLISVIIAIIICLLLFLFLINLYNLIYKSSKQS